MSVKTDTENKKGMLVLGQLPQTSAQEAAELEARAMETQGTAVKKLHEMGVSLRDIGCLLGISHQRAHQLVKA